MYKNRQRMVQGFSVNSPGVQDEPLSSVRLSAALPARLLCARHRYEHHHVSVFDFMTRLGERCLLVSTWDLALT